LHASPLFDFSTLSFLVQSALTGENFFGCGSRSAYGNSVWWLTLIFYAMTGLLLLNMLIAMSALR
jgi:hypothetical protein